MREKWRKQCLQSLDTPWLWGCSEEGTRVLGGCSFVSIHNGEKGTLVKRKAWLREVLILNICHMEKFRGQPLTILPVVFVPVSDPTMVLHFFKGDSPLMASPSFVELSLTVTTSFFSSYECLLIKYSMMKSSMWSILLIINILTYLTIILFQAPGAQTEYLLPLSLQSRREDTL